MANIKFSAFDNEAVTVATTELVGYKVGDTSANYRYNMGQIAVGIFAANSGLTTGSVLFTGASGITTQDNANFFWDNTAKNLKVVKRKFTVTSAVDGNADGDVVYSGTGASVVGELYYFNGTDWVHTDANTASSAAAKGLLGVALGTDTDVDGMLIRGMVTLDHDPGTAGDVLYISGTAGEITSTAPSTSGDTVRIVGYCMDSTNGQIWFDPSPQYIELA